jgi:drug/metabolite transporter (DMT)-like permease
MSCAVFSAVAFLVIRKMGGTVHFLHNVTYFSAMCLPMSFLCGFFFQSRAPLASSAAGSLSVAEDMWERFMGFYIEEIGWFGWGLILATTVSGFVGQALLSRGLQLEKAGRATLMNYLQVR